MMLVGAAEDAGACFARPKMPRCAHGINEAGAAAAAAEEDEGEEAEAEEEAAAAAGAGLTGNLTAMEM